MNYKIDVLYYSSSDKKKKNKIILYLRFSFRAI